eukprot:546334-Prymnesium_polylepis.1
MLRRHDRYLSVFGDTPPKLLELGYGPSQKHPGSECLYAIYYPDDPGPGPWLRLDIGVDITFSNSLHEPADATPKANLSRRIQHAVREESRQIRQWSLENSPCVCSSCGCALTNLLRTQFPDMVVPAGTVEGEFHHVYTVAELAERVSAEFDDPESSLQAPPNHHFFKPGPIRDTVREALYKPGATALVCAKCHGNETAEHNRLSSALATPSVNPVPPLNAWWSLMA